MLSGAEKHAFDLILVGEVLPGFNLLDMGVVGWRPR